MVAVTALVAVMAEDRETVGVECMRLSFVRRRQGDRAPQHNDAAPIASALPDGHASRREPSRARRLLSEAADSPRVVKPSSAATKLAGAGRRL
jgi:hypothetical protein